MAEAAARLGVTSDAIYKGLRRGTYTGHKTRAGEWRVVLPDSHQTRLERPLDSAQTPRDASPAAAQTGAPEPSSALVDALQARIDSLEAHTRFLEAELEARRKEIELRDEEIKRREGLLIVTALSQPPALVAEAQPIEIEPPTGEPRPNFWRRLFRH